MPPGYTVTPSGQLVPLDPPAGPLAEPPLPPQPGPTIIPTDPIAPSAAPTAPGAELAPAPGGAMVTATKSPKAMWGLFALGLLGAGA